jgi:hypothetical protein
VRKGPLRAIVDYCPDRYPRRFEATRFSVADPDVLLSDDD